jgi:hypothetical protein
MISATATRDRKSGKKYFKFNKLSHCTSGVTAFYPSPEPPRAGFERFVQSFAAGIRADAVGFYTIISWFPHPTPPRNTVELTR